MFDDASGWHWYEECTATPQVCQKKSCLTFDVHWWFLGPWKPSKRPQSNGTQTRIDNILRVSKGITRKSGLWWVAILMRINTRQFMLVHGWDSWMMMIKRRLYNTQLLPRFIISHPCIIPSMGFVYVESASATTQLAPGTIWASSDLSGLTRLTGLTRH